MVGHPTTTQEGQASSETEHEPDEILNVLSDFLLRLWGWQRNLLFVFGDLLPFKKQ